MTSLLKLALFFFVIALLARWFGYSKIASSSKTVSKILFAIFVIAVLCVVVFVTGLVLTAVGINVLAS